MSYPFADLVPYLSESFFRVLSLVYHRRRVPEGSVVMFLSTGKERTRLPGTVTDRYNQIELLTQIDID